METKKEKFKGCLGGLLSVLLLLFFIGMCSEPEDNNMYISGADPTFVCASLRGEGFDVEHIYNEEYGWSWDAKKTINGIDLLASIYSPKSSEKLQSIRATVMVQAGIKDIEAGKFFIKYISSMPYKGSQETTAINWVEEHYYHPEDTVIGNVLFSLKAPSKYVRILTISALN